MSAENDARNKLNRETCVMTDKMKPCPFCGGTAKELAEGYVSCCNHDCPMSAMSMTVDAWNSRAPDPLVAELLDICRDFVAKCDRGQARSVKTYGRMKEALAKARGRKGVV